VVAARTGVALLAAAVLGVFPNDAGAADPSPLGRLLGDPALRGARVGALVIDLETGEEIYAHESTRALAPASSAKIVTAAAALVRWGPAFRFETPVRAAGRIDEAGVLDGDLWIVGRGDPGLVSEELWRLAEELRLRGLREVRGNVGVDSSYFDAVRWPPDRGTGNGRAYDAPVAGLAVNYSSFRIDVGPGAKVGAPLRVSVAPDVPYFLIRGGGRTLMQPGRLQISVAPRPDGSGDAVSVGGSIRVDEGPETFWRAVSHPELYAGALLRAQLEAQGIAVRGAVRVGQAPVEGDELLRFRGESLGRIVWKMNKFSNNFIAGELTKALGAERYGAPGSWSKGARALTDHLRSLGPLEADERLVDGSGLSPRNRLSARTLVRVLRNAARNFGWGPEFLASLPLGGLDGTLEDRLVGVDVSLRAKTGHISGVAALCGVVPDAGGRRLGFAVLVNGARAGRTTVDTVLDTFVTRLADLEPGSASGSGD
jgi:D-alanyl-D-alanine carboxypeptidase/D-alanyl-D-alanine-endopeptidase (penicillin-binding protein 4)